MSVSSYVSAGILVGISTSSMMGIVVLDICFLFIFNPIVEDGTSSTTKRSTTLPDRKHISLQGTEVME